MRPRDVHVIRRLALVLGLAVAGCASSDPPAAGGIETERAVWTALCESEQITECPPPRRTASACMEIQERRASLARVRAIDSGRAVVDPRALEECLSSIRCGSTTSACERWLVGLVGEGDACEDDAVCGDGLFCDRVPGACGTCRPRLPLGAPCRRRAECAPPADPSPELSTHCRRSGTDMDPMVCTLAERIEVGPGDPCDVVVVSAQHVLAPVCVGASVCTVTAEGRVCTTSLAAEGEACGAGFDLCEGDLVCSALEVCAPIGSRVGDVCDGAGVAGCDPSRGLTCLAGQCEPIPGSPGDLCNRHDPIPCGHGMVCRETTCGAPLDLGSRCSDDADCASRRCDGGVCTSLRCG